MEIADRKYIINAKKPLILHILLDDIKRSKRKNSAMCAAACAIQRELNCAEVRIHLSRVYVLENEKWVRYMTPKSLRQEIVAFDRGGSFQPGEHFLSAPPPTKQTGKHQGGVIRPHKKYLPRHSTENIRPEAGRGPR